MRKIILLSSFVFFGCQSIDFLSDFMDRFDHVPLRKFVATDSDFFPRFIDKIFPQTNTFELNHSSIDAANRDFSLIGLKRLTGDKNQVNEANLSWSADGVYLGYEEIGKKDRKILIRDLIGAYSHSVFLMPKKEDSLYSSIAGTDQFSFNAGLRWSLDSTHYAFMSNGGVGQFDIYLGAIGLEDRKISNSQSKDGFAVWSPTKKELVFVSGRSGNGDLYLLNVRNDTLKRITASKEPDLFPEWSPNGKEIVFTLRKGKVQQLFVIQKQEGVWSKNPMQLTALGTGVFRPVFSRDGSKIAFYTKNSQSHRYALAIAELNRKNGHSIKKIRIVSEDVVPDMTTGPAFSPDARYLFYVKNDLSQFNPIALYDFKKSKEELVDTKTQMNRDVKISKLGVLSFRAQVGAWDRVFIALTNTGHQFNTEIASNKRLAKK